MIRKFLLLFVLMIVPVLPASAQMPYQYPPSPYQYPGSPYPYQGMVQSVNPMGVVLQMASGAMQFLPTGANYYNPNGMQMPYSALAPGMPVMASLPPGVPYYAPGTYPQGFYPPTTYIQAPPQVNTVYVPVNTAPTTTYVPEYRHDHWFANQQQGYVTPVNTVVPVSNDYHHHHDGNQTYTTTTTTTPVIERKGQGL